MHDAAIAAWGTKSYYDYVRPISMIRYMGGLGQSSDAAGPSYHPDGLPLDDGLIEIVTRRDDQSPGERHEHLADHVGEVAVLAWRGIPADPESEAGGVGWILAVDWVPYQLPTFVTPSFASYVSGHSAFSRAGAEVLTPMTGSEFFPGGLGTLGDPGRVARVRTRTRARMSFSSGPPTATPPTRPGSPASTGGSTSVPTTFGAGRSGRVARSGLGACAAVLRGCRLDCPRSRPVAMAAPVRGRRRSRGGSVRRHDRSRSARRWAIRCSNGPGADEIAGVPVTFCIGVKAQYSMSRRLAVSKSRSSARWPSGTGGSDSVGDSIRS